VATSPEHRRLARNIAAESATLLKNDGGVLPLSPAAVQTLALVGSACDAGNPVSDLLWNIGSYYVVGGSGRVLSRRAVSIVEGVRSRARVDNIIVVESLSDNVENALKVFLPSHLSLRSSFISSFYSFLDV
jgi:beta-glucosidase